MFVLRIKDRNIALELRNNTLKNKPIENYSAKYVEFIVSTRLSSQLANIGSIYAAWNVKQNCWEGSIVHLGKKYFWVINT